MKKIIMTKAVYRQICETIGCCSSECGGILGAAEGDAITDYYFDSTGRSLPNGYAPDVETINRILANDWMPRGVLMVGIVHNHTNNIPAPSCGDISYGILILQALDTIDHFHLPILTHASDGIRLDFYVIRSDPERQFVCQRIDYAVVD